MYVFDTMLIAMNHCYTKQKFEEQAIPAAAKKGMLILGMKLVVPRENIDNLNPQELINYGLSLEHISWAVIGIDSLQILKENIELIKTFTPLSPSRMEEIRTSLTPFYKHENLVWMNPNYIDVMNFS
ncbi:MAG: hypothetical protein QNJ64_04780 [Crocosphaera sp.]|nr:hypothetical protein [Crocosphaera sp.]